MGAGLIDWGALLPPPVCADTPEREPISPETGEISPTWGKDDGIEGKCRSASNAALQDFSPISPISPEKMGKVRKEADTGGGGGQEMGCARRMNLGDLITCRECRNLAVECEPPACRIASLKPGALVRAVPGYRPVMIPQRCRGFMPLADELDQRLGVVRWPGV